MSNINELNQCPCDKLDPKCVGAYFSYGLTPENPAIVMFGNSWGEQTLDLTPAIAAGETLTSLELTDTALQYNSEAYGRKNAVNGGIDCINGDNLSRIISLSKLKDVSQATALANGDTYVWNAVQGVFEPYNIARESGNLAAQVAALQLAVNTLQTQVQSYSTAISELQSNMADLQATMSALQSTVSTQGNSISALQAVTAKPTYVPASATLTWGTINSVASGYTGKGLYTHNPSNNVSGDMEFAA